MESLLDRTEADNRGVKQTTPHQQGGAPASSSSGDRRESSSGSGARKKQSVVMAGEANKKGGIFDRLTNQDSYTGVSS